MKTVNVYRFGSYRLDETTRVLTRDGTPITITPKTLDTLLYLVANAGRTVSREEIIKAVWPDTFVEEGNLNYNISQLRRILGEQRSGLPYIQTVPKQGYRFVADVYSTSELKTLETPTEVVAPKRDRLKQNRWAWPAAAILTLAGVLIALWFFVPRRNATDERASGLIRVTSDSGLTMTPALSLDGKLVAYASDRSGEGNLNIWIQQVGGAQPIRLTQGPSNDYAPNFSPDGRTIAFRSEREGGGIYAVPALGGDARLITTGGRRPRFSPDGKWIACWIGTEPGDISSSFLTPGAGHLRIVSAAGGQSRELRSEFPAAAYPTWTPDGEHLLFLGNRDPNGFVSENSVDWWVTPIDGGPAIATGASALFRRQGLTTVSQVPETWTSDGEAVLISASLAETRNIWRIPISSTTWKVSGNPRRVTFGTIMDMQPSASGNQMVFASLNGSMDVWGLPIDADHIKPSGGLQRLTQDSFPHSYPVVSPDGTKVAFSSRRSGSRDIWVKDLRTGKETVVSNPPGPSFYPNISPHGSMVTFEVHNGQSSVGHLAPLSGGAAQRVCDDCTDLSWSSDENRLLVRGKSPSRISVLDLASKLRTPLLDHSSYLLWNARFSPDDRWVGFNATTSGHSRIFVAPFRSTGLVPESEWIAIAEGPWDDKPRWSPDGNIIYFVSERDRFRCIWAQHLDVQKHPTGPAIAVFHAHDARRSLTNVGIGDLVLSVAPDKLVFNMSERTGNIWLARTSN